MPHYLTDEDAFLTTPLPDAWLPAPVPCPDGAFRGPGWVVHATAVQTPATRLETLRLEGVLYLAQRAA